jgi:hypothetical protein
LRRTIFERYREDDLRGVRFALNVFLGATALWAFLLHVAGVNPVWGIAAMITGADPILTDARRDARASLINTTVGCLVGLVVLLVGEPSEWRLPIAVSAAVLVSSYFVRIPGQWRQADHRRDRHRLGAHAAFETYRNRRRRAKSWRSVLGRGGGSRRELDHVEDMAPAGEGRRREMKEISS